MPVKFVILRNSLTNPELFQDVMDFDKVILVPDFTIVTVGNFNVLCIGGSITNNRQWKKNNIRRKSVIYFEDEAPYFDDDAVNEMCQDKDMRIHIIVSNMSPTFIGEDVYTFIGKWAENDKTLFDDVMNAKLKFDTMLQMFRKNNKLPYIWSYDGGNGTSDMMNLAGTLFIGRPDHMQNLTDFLPIRDMGPRRTRHISIKDMIENGGNRYGGRGLFAMPHFDEHGPQHFDVGGFDEDAREDEDTPEALVDHAVDDPFNAEPRAFDIPYRVEQTQDGGIRVRLADNGVNTVETANTIAYNAAEIIDYRPVTNNIAADVSLINTWITTTANTNIGDQ